MKNCKLVKLGIVILLIIIILIELAGKNKVNTFGATDTTPMMVPGFDDVNVLTYVFSLPDKTIDTTPIDIEMGSSFSNFDKALPPSLISKSKVKVNYILSPPSPTNILPNQLYTISISNKSPEAGTMIDIPLSDTRTNNTILPNITFNAKWEKQPTKIVIMPNLKGVTFNKDNIEKVLGDKLIKYFGYWQPGSANMNPNAKPDTKWPKVHPSFLDEYGNKITSNSLDTMKEATIKKTDPVENKPIPTLADMSDLKYFPEIKFFLLLIK